MSAEVSPVLHAPAVRTVSVVICCYTDERWEDLRHAVVSARDQTRPPHEVVVVVDHNPALLARVRTELRGVLAVPNEHERGLSGARNTGVAASTGEIVAFLDDDAMADPDWLERLAAGYEDPDVLGVGGWVEPLWPGGRPRAMPHEFDWVVGCSYLGLPPHAAAVRNVIGANMSLRRAVLDEVGSFQHGMGRIDKRPLGCEETELCIRAGRRWPEGRILFEPAARVRHRVAPERTTWRYFRSRCYAEGLSKAAVARHAGAGAGLASERAHVLRALPAGVVRGIADAVAGRDAAGLLRAGGIVAGLAMTTAGYVVGSVRRPQGGAA